LKNEKRKTTTLKKRLPIAIGLLVLMAVFLVLLATTSDMPKDHAINEHENNVISEYEHGRNEPQYPNLSQTDESQNETNDNQDDYTQDALPDDLYNENDGYPYDDKSEDDENGSDDEIEDFPFRPGTPNGLHRPYEGEFELPVTGATGWSAGRVQMRSQPNSNASVIKTLSPGQAFLILAEDGQWWNIRLGSDGETGWIPHRHCFINLPDIIPSIVYNITNAQASVTRANMTDIPNVTGHARYEAFSFNHRLDRYEFIVPALYSTSQKIMRAQQTALADGNTLIIYEVFRPRSSQQNAVRHIQQLMETDPEVYNALTAPPWGLNWFIATTLSNHQRGVAIDMSLGTIDRARVDVIGGFPYWKITEYTQFEMPTTMHELSPRAALLSRPVTSTSLDAWRSVPFADTITDGVLLMVEYATEAGLTPLASEWWHFNDLNGRTIAMEANITGEFYTPTIYSMRYFSQGSP